jgi:hypothetical protein
MNDGSDNSVEVSISLTSHMHQTMKELAQEGNVELSAYITQLLGQALATELLRRQLVEQRTDD